MSDPSDSAHNPFENIIHEASAQLEGAHPGMPEFIAELSHSHLGRAIAMRDGQRPGSETKLVGYCLPRNEVETAHLLILENGHMYGISVSHPAEVIHYQQAFATSDEPLLYNDSRVSSVEERILIGSSYDRSSRISNLDEKGAETMPSLVEQALSTARVLKEKREAAIRKTAQNFMDQFGPLLGIERPSEPEPGQE